MDVYINDMAVFLPNAPVDNDHIEQVLGKIGDIPSKTKEKILANNGIQTRYYAIDPATGKPICQPAEIRSRRDASVCGRRISG